MRKSHLSLPASPRSALPAVGALQALERAAAHLSFSRAAKDLGLSPSAVSHQIRGLEALLGVRLFARAARTVRLTPQGEFYVAAVREALGTLDKATRDMIRMGGGDFDIRISALPFFTSTVLVPALGEFEQRFPKATLRIETTHSYADFDDGGVDVAVRFGRERATGLSLEPLVAVRSVPVCTPQLAETRLAAPSDISKVPLIHVMAQPEAWSEWAGEIGLESFESKGNLWFDNVLSALDAAACGQGVALGMDPLVRAHADFGTRLTTPFPEALGSSGAFYLAIRPEQKSDARIESVSAWIRSAIDGAQRVA